MKPYLLIFAMIILVSCQKKSQDAESEFSEASTDTTAIVDDSQFFNDEPEEEVALENYSFRDPNLADYQQYLESLDKSKVENVADATRKFNELFASRSKAMCDSAYYLFEKFYSGVDDKINEQSYDGFDSLFLGSSNGEKIKLSKRITDFDNKYRSNGFQPAWTEGIVYLTKDREYVKQNFYQQLTPLMIEYLDQLNKENQQGFQEDGGIIIEYNTLVDRTVWWERFNKNNPTFIFKQTPSDKQKIYTWTLITGADNTPIFQSPNGGFSEDFKGAYDYMFVKYPDSETATLLRPYYSYLVRWDTAGIRKYWQEKIGTTPYFN
ncbi:MAG: hypothetical protein HOP08_12555 [Cyclobacteriaceae bacterium]|nr:hypothetical protein [Cyclobacteriaceae bacterium]